MPSNLARLLRPRHIAFIGSIQAEGSIAACRRAGYTGEIWTVRTTRATIGGVNCVEAISELPHAPDAALLALSAARTVEAVAELSALGAGGAVCMAAGFAEVGEHGKQLQKQLAEKAGDMVVLGPNCMGLINLFDGAVVWGADNFAEHPGNNGAAVISQSGAYLFGMTNVEQDFPLGYAISTGNEVNLHIAGAMHGVLDDNRVNAIGIYLEGLTDGSSLGLACNRARDMGIPVIALKGGDTAAGAAVAHGHTASMVVDINIWDAFCSRYGVIQVSSPKGMVEALKLLTICGVPKGPRLSVITHSGGLNSQIVAHSPALGLALPQPTEANAQRMRDRLPDSVPVANPLDLNLPFRSSTTVSLADKEAITDSLIDLTRDVSDIMIMFMDVPRSGFGMEECWLPSLEAVIETRKRTGLPCALSGIFPDGLELAHRQRLAACNVAPLAGYDEAMKAISVAAACSAIQQGETRSVGLLSSAGTPVTGAPRLVDENQSKEMLFEHGVKFPKRWVGAGSDAPAAADAMRYPVVVKILSDQIAHKDKIGGVKLHLQSAGDVKRAVDEITTAVANQISHPRFLVEEMVVDATAEIIIGLKRDTAMGLVMAIGFGGTDVEKKAEFVTLLLPLHERDLDVALECLQMQHAEGLRTAIHAAASFANRYHDTLLELDINPVIITSDDDAIAVDALVVFADKDI